MMIVIIIFFFFFFFRYFFLLLLLWMISFTLVLFYAYVSHQKVMNIRSINIQVSRSIGTPAWIKSNESQPPPSGPSDPVSCECQLRNLSSYVLYEAQLSLPVPWLNLTSKEVLERTHPNLPVNMYNDVASMKWCKMLPALSTYVFSFHLFLRCFCLWKKVDCSWILIVVCLAG